MPKFSLRPHTTALLVPGNARNAAHAGDPAPGKQAHHKLHQLDGAAARREALAPHFGLAGRVREYLAEPLPAAADADTSGAAAAQPAAPGATAPRKATRALRKFLGKAGTALGLRAGKPVGLDALTRFRDTAAAGARPIERGAPADRDTWRSVGTAQARAFTASQRLHEAEVAARKATALEHLVQLHIERLDSDAQRAGRRIAHAADRPVPLRRQQAAIAAQQQALDASIARLAEEAEALERRIAQAEAALAAPVRGRLGTLLAARTEADRSGADTGEDVAALRQHLHELRSLHTIRTGIRHGLEQRRQDVQAELQRLERSAVAMARDLFDADDEAADLRSLLGGLQERRTTLEAARDAARAASEAAGAALKACEKEMAGRQIDTLPGLRTPATPAEAAACAALKAALRDWSGGLDTALFGDRAIPAAGVVAVGLKALAVAAGGDPAQALQALGVLRRLRWEDLAPAPGAEAARTAAAGMPPAAQRTVDQLARVPRGLQVLSHLLCPEGSPAAHPERLAAARLALRADALLRAAAPDDAGLRTWLGHARRAARRALHAAEPAKALAACTVDERAAYHALRNGYESNAPGSAYDRANGHLQRLADALHDLARHGARPRAFGGQPNALRSLPQALEVGSATALPTPRRRADAALEKAAGQLSEMLGGLRADRPPGRLPGPAECAWQALAETVQWAPEGTDRTTLVIDAAAHERIAARATELRAHFERTARGQGVPPPELSQDSVPLLEAAWQRLERRPHTAAEALALLAEGLPEDAGGPSSPPPPPPPGGTPVSWHGYALQQGAQFRASAQEAARLLREGVPGQATHAQALLDLTRDMIGQLEWRDRLRLIGQQSWGLNAGPLSAAVALGSSVFGLGVRLIAGAQRNRDAVMEFYMGRTGMYLQIGEQRTDQVQVGAGANTGYAANLGTDQATLGGTVAADWRWRGERGLENGIQLRLPRLGKGREPELNVEFLDAYEHLLRLAEPGPDGAPARHDWLRELLAHHPELSAGLIDDAQRSSTGTETNVSASAGLRVGEVAGRGRRAGVAASLGAKMRQDNGRTATTIAGYMTTVYRDATASSRVEVSARATASVQIAEALRSDGARTAQRASAGLGGLDAGYAVEVANHATTNFCTLFLFGDEIDPTRSDRATDYSRFEEFERHVRAQWDGWAHYGTGKLGSDVEEPLHHLVADIQLSHFMEQTRSFAQANGFAAMFADKVMRPPAGPLLDVHRALAALARAAGDEDGARAEDAAFDDFLQNEAMWEPTLLLLREKARLQEERGLDFFLKHQNNRGAEAMRTVGQWILYEPVPRREPGQHLQPARTWEQPSPAPRGAQGADGTAGPGAGGSSRYETASEASLDSFRTAPGSPMGPGEAPGALAAAEGPAAGAGPDAAARPGGAVPPGAASPSRP
ncbi:putative secreted protein [Paracidovorax avenae ATCC 19860]|uniref:Putative secreted protein n=1 Tax=Paracidovorax avenae (strain ATCC 19860 / DSM 7227 / CCUG 15838 / JCM 20985 / LMG 2117 / NCPPB 1011) TaxID=643561 RepID=F0Q4U8_PARA1|nr:putative secreted protein [Paracidovorax avenae ATCC 19860]